MWGQRIEQHRFIVAYNSTSQSMLDQMDHPQLSTLTQPQIRHKLGQALAILDRTSPSNEQLAFGHGIISDMMKSQLFFQISIGLIIEFQNNKQRPNIAKLVMTTLSAFIKHQTSHSKLVKKINKATLNQQFLNVFLKSELTQECKVMLMRSYMVFIYAPGMQTIRGQLVDHVCSSFSLATFTLDAQLVDSGLYFDRKKWQIVYPFVPIAQGLVRGPLQSGYMRAIVGAFYVPLTKLILYGLGQLRQSISSRNEALFLQISDIVDKLISFWRQLIIGSKNALYLQKIQMMQDPLLIQIFKQTIALSFNKPTTNIHQITELVIDTNGHIFLDRLNQMKKNCMDVANGLIKLVVNAQKKPAQAAKQQYILPKQLALYILQTLPGPLLSEFVALQYPKLPLPNPALYRSIIQTLANIIRINDFFKISEQLRNSLIFTLALPLLQPSQKISSAIQYRHMRQDIVNMHSMDLPQNMVCKLFESYVDKIDGSVIHFANQIKNMIEFHLSANPNVFSALPSELTNSHFFQNTDYLTQIECGMTVLTLLSYLAPTREDLVLIIQSIMASRQEFLFNEQREGSFKCGLLLCYTYYIDNFYSALVRKTSNSRQFHLRVVQRCCNYIQAFVNNSEKSLKFSLQVAALQAIDCLGNCINQQLFLQALFWSQSTGIDKASQAYFVNLFTFLVKQLEHSMNISIVDALVSFYFETIKNHCAYGFKIKRYQYQYKSIPLIIRADLTNLIADHFVIIYSNSTLPNHLLLKNRMTHLMQYMLTCCEDPYRLINQQFFALKFRNQDIWDIVDVLDVFVRRLIGFNMQGIAINPACLQPVMQFCFNMVGIFEQQLRLKKVFGILVSMIVIDQNTIEYMAPKTASFLVDLLQQQEQSINYNQDLQKMINEIAYINLIAIHKRFSAKTKSVWCQLIRFLQQFIANRSSKGLLASRSSIYNGKLLGICLVCLFNMRQQLTAQDSETTSNLLKNIIRTSDSYLTLVQKQIVALTLIKMMKTKPVLTQNDHQFKKSFELISSLLYFAFNRMSVSMQFGDDQQQKQSSGMQDSDEQGNFEKEESLSYKEYTVNQNEYVRKQQKEPYILAFKDLCHQLNNNSHLFLKKCVDQLSLPLQRFVKEQVYFFQGELPQQGMRKIHRVKKQ